MVDLMCDICHEPVRALKVQEDGMVWTAYQHDAADIPHHPIPVYPDGTQPPTMMPWNRRKADRSDAV